MLQISIRPRAQLDLESVYVYVAVIAAAPQTADRLVTSLYAQIEQLAEFPELGRLFENGRLTRSYRRILCNSYWIYYYADNQTLTVTRIFHTSRDIDDFTAIDL